MKSENIKVALISTVITAMVCCCLTMIGIVILVATETLQVDITQIGAGNSNSFVPDEKPVI